MRSRESLKQLQSLPIDLKISLSKDRIRQWVNEFGESGCHVSFSGGKDSTVLLHLVRSLYPDVKALFIDTGLEFPEVRSHVKSFDNVFFRKPLINFRDVILRYGYPFISKDVSGALDRIQHKPDSKKIKQFDGSMKGSLFDFSHFSFLLNSPFKFSDRCCNELKKKPAHLFAKEFCSFPFVGTLASESVVRTNSWIKFGCNSFSQTFPRSAPLSFWTEQDILLYIKRFNLPIPSVYGDIVPDFDKLNVPDGQCSFDFFNPYLKCNGCSRTGCMFCGFGCHLGSDKDRFVRLKISHPQIYDYVFKPIYLGGLGFKDVIDWINDHGNLDIHY